MHNTRSSQRKARRTSGTPLISPHKRASSQSARSKPPKGSKPLKLCSHDAPACVCGSDIRPGSSTDYRLSCLPPSTLTEEFIAGNLGLTGDDLVHLICTTKCVKDALVATLDDQEILQHSPSTKAWRIVSQDEVVPWLSRVAQNLQAIGVFTVIDPAGLDALEDETTATDWTPVTAADVDMHRGYVSLKRSLGRLWACTFLVPTVMQVITLTAGTGPSPTLAAKLAHPDSGPAKPFLMYQAVKLGLGIVSSTKLGIWDRALAAQTRMQLAKLMSAAASHVQQGGSRSDEDLESRLLARLATERDRAVDAEAALARRIQRAKDRAVRTGGIIAAVNTKVEHDRVQLLKLQERIDVEAVTAAAGRITVQEQFTACETQRADDREAVEQRVGELQNLRETDRITSEERFTAIEHQHESDRLSVDDRLANMQSGITLQGGHISSVLHAVTLQGSELHETRQIFAAQISHLFSTMQPAASAVAPVIPTATPATPPPPPRLFLRIRNPPLDIDTESEMFDRFTRIFVMGESTFRVAHQVVSSLHVPFLVVMMGYSGGGKSYTMLQEDGVVAAIIGTLPSPLNVTITEIGETTRPMADLLFPRNTVVEILAKITSCRTTSPTPANATSSRTHIMVQFENLAAGVVYGCLVDVCGAEESVHRAEGGGRGSGDGSKARGTAIAQENVAFRLMLMELAANGKSGFTTRGKVSVVKHASPLNLAVGRFLKEVVGDPQIRVVACMDGGMMGQVGKVLSVMPDF